MIEVKHLTKRYGNNVAVEDLNFTVESGKIYGFLGPNGAGKSTTMNIMAGCLAASSGEVYIDGHEIFDEAGEAKRMIGYLPELPPLYLDMTPREYLEFVARAKNISQRDFSEQIEHAVSVTQIGEVENRLIKNLSKGYRQRVGIAQALIGNPEVIILDEPTVGLDPLQIIEIRDLIKELGKTHTVILSSHILPEVRAVCDEIMIISHGRLVASDTPENLEKIFAGKTSLEICTRADIEKVRSILGGVDRIKSIESAACDIKDAFCASLEFEGDDISESVFFAFANAGVAILRMSIKSVSLEDIFLELTSHDAAESAPIKKPNDEENANDGYVKQFEITNSESEGDNNDGNTEA